MLERDEIVEILWRKAEKMLFVKKEDFVRELLAWELKSVEVDGVTAFITAQRGPHFHFDTLEEGHRISRRLITQTLQPIIEKYGFAETQTPKEDERQHRFNKAFGFVPVGEDEFFVTYRICNIKGAPCPSSPS